MISDLNLPVAALGLTLSSLLAGLLWSSPAEATVWRTVNCTNGGNIQSRMNSAVAAASTGEAVIVNVIGECRQDVTVTGDNVTLRTKPGNPRAEIKGTVTIDAATRFSISNLKLTGSSYGIEVTNGATGAIDDIRATGNERSGIRASLGASVTVTDSKIDNNGRNLPARDAGIEVLDSATVLSTGNLIEKNAFAAVSVSSHAVFRNGLRDDPDDDQKDKDRDTYIQRGCQDGASPGCGLAGGAVVALDIDGLAELRNARTTGTLRVDGVSKLEMSTGRLFGDVFGDGHSGISISTTVTGEGNLSCANNAFSYGAVVYNCGSNFLATP
ncbi:MAG TPA: right-handed parallel beta-helix repeat-containing protein [Kiloniellaceae bacterium]|nr:right-handed parallel beta-helix repeat-containing protein [Kiloniellaceae bacterium]